MQETDVSWMKSTLELKFRVLLLLRKQ
jgi:hypothetical protein